MTRRATFTEAELARAIRVADKLGKTAVQTPSGIAFVQPIGPPPEPAPNRPAPTTLRTHEPNI